MFDGLSEQARHVMALGQKAALELGHARVGTEHLLLGLLAEREDLAARALGAHGVTASRARDELAKTSAMGEASPNAGTLPYSRRAKRALQEALRISLQQDAAAVKNEHIFLGLLAGEDSTARKLLTRFGVDATAVRSEMTRMSSRSSEPAAREASSSDQSPGGRPTDAPSATLAVPSPEQTSRSGAVGDHDLTLALAHLHQLGVPSRYDGYTPEDATRVLQGRSVDPAVEDTIHNKLAWIVGVQIVGHIKARLPRLGWTTDLVPVRTLLDGESSASFMPFPDDSYAVFVSRALQESLIRMANVVEYVDITTATARLSLRRRKREKVGFETAARVTAIFRYLLLGQRMLGRAPSAPAVLDPRSFDIAGKMAAGALTFVVAHEIAHIAHGHKDSSVESQSPGSRVTVSEVQELQADAWALSFLKELMSDDPDPENMALWCAFIALFATQITDEAVYVRRNRTHPQAYARWHVLTEQANRPDDRTERLRLSLMAAIGGALELGEPFPQHLWAHVWKDPALTIDPAIGRDTVMRWDYLQTCPLDVLAAEAEQSATADGRALIDALRRGDMREALSRIVTPRRMAAMLDPDSALGFATVKEAIEIVAPQLTQGDRLLFSITGARLAARHMGGVTTDG